MRRTPLVLTAFAVLAMALMPVGAEARAGYGNSMGSRGGRTFSPPPSTSTSPGYAQPMQRSITPNSPAPSSPGYSGGLASAPRPGLFGGGFGAGLMGGLIGAGIGGMLFGHGMFGGISGFGSIFGLLIQLALVYFVVRWLFRMLRARQPAMAGGPSMFLPHSAPPNPAAMGIGGGPTASPIQIQPADFQVYEALLARVQAAWSAQDLNGLRPIVSPEMLGYFGEQLADQASRGVRNTVTDVHLKKGDLSEAWTEQGRDYATVAMQFSMLDVTTDAQNHVVDGSSTEHVTATELWTFVRSRGGNWILSAIQQAR